MMCIFHEKRQDLMVLSNYNMRWLSSNNIRGNNTLLYAYGYGRNNTLLYDKKYLLKTGMAQIMIKMGSTTYLYFCLYMYLTKT